MWQLAHSQQLEICTACDRAWVCCTVIIIWHIFCVEQFLYGRLSRESHATTCDSFPRSHALDEPLGSHSTAFNSFSRRHACAVLGARRRPRPHESPFIAYIPDTSHCCPPGKGTCSCRASPDSEGTQHHAWMGSQHMMGAVFLLDQSRHARVTLQLVFAQVLKQVQRIAVLCVCLSGDRHAVFQQTCWTILPYNSLHCTLWFAIVRGPPSKHKAGAVCTCSRGDSRCPPHSVWRTQVLGPVVSIWWRKSRGHNSKQPCVGFRSVTRRKQAAPADPHRDAQRSRFLHSHERWTLNQLLIIIFLI